jgi:dihydroflavonol-4-reductase
MRIFVTGGNGFIGSVVVGELVASGHEVVCLLRSGGRRDRLAGLAVEHVPGDVCDVGSFRQAMSSCDCTIHLAAPGGWSRDDPSQLRRVIEGGARNVIGVARELRKHRVVLVSSTAAIGASDVPQVFDERAVFAAPSRRLPYAYAKHRAEVLAWKACRDDVPVVIVNPSEVYGPNDFALGTACNVIDFATSWPVLVCRGGTGIVHVADVAKGIIAAMERGQPGERYILSAENLTIRELAERVLDLLGRRAPIVDVPNVLARTAAAVVARLHVPVPFNPYVVPYATRYWFVDNTKARHDLGVSFRDAGETLRSTLSWLQAEGRV